jgi:hypothetical protein
MKPTITYRVGFEHPDVSSFISDRNPGFVPVVKLGGSAFAFGEVVALAEDENMARGFAEWLNAVERAKARA